MDIGAEIHAPLSDGQELGTLTILMDEEKLMSIPLVALNAVEEAGFFSRIWDAISLFFMQIFGGDPLKL
jgi:D-alanyl-D-alanine carboxypeptidase (penicillin-binding protein 5/6)